MSLSLCVFFLPSPMRLLSPPPRASPLLRLAALPERLLPDHSGRPPAGASAPQPLQPAAHSICVRPTLNACATMHAWRGQCTHEYHYRRTHVCCAAAAHDKDRINAQQTFYHAFSIMAYDKGRSATFCTTKRSLPCAV